MINTSSKMTKPLLEHVLSFKAMAHATLSLICSESARYDINKVLNWIGEMKNWNDLHKILNGGGGMLQPPTIPVGLQMKAVMKEVDININRICPNTVPDLPPGTHAYDPESNNIIERFAKVDISRVHASNDSDGPRTFEQYSVKALCFGKNMDIRDTWWAYRVCLIWCPVRTDWARPGVSSWVKTDNVYPFFEIAVYNVCLHLNKYCG